jgi:hypothetical protein
MARETYIVNGQVQRGPERQGMRTYYWQYLSWRRVWQVVIIAAVVIATNPANQNVFFANRQRSAYKRTTSQLLSRRVTNYLFFSVEEKFESVVISALQQSWSCSYNDMAIGNFCDMIGESSLSQLPRKNII